MVRLPISAIALSLLLLAPTGGRAADAAQGASLSARDRAWLDRVTFGVDSATLERFRTLGAKRFLRQQLDADAGSLPVAVRAQIGALDAERLSIGDLARQLADLRRQRGQAGDEAAKRAIAKQIRQRGHALAEQAAQAQLLRAIYSPDQLREQMVWFWANHFSVFQRKGVVGWFIPNYIDHTLRPHALGRFRDLVMATLTSPAMQLYLDNVHNVRGHNNENYARELMELHVLGVHAGYSQQDVQALMHILSGAGLALPSPRMARATTRPDFVRAGLFVFNPRRHDDAPQILLGRRIDAHGYAQIEQAVDWLTRQPACAHFIAGELARYFVGDAPPPALVERMAATFRRTDGDIAAVLHTLFTAPELGAVRPQFKDPMRFLVSAMRLSYDGQPVADAQRLPRILKAMGEPLYERITPDGWSLNGADWQSSGQLTQRFEVARLIGAGLAVLPPGATPAQRRAAEVPDIGHSRAFHDALAPFLSAGTRSVLAGAGNRRAWNGYLLASPAFNQR